MAVVPGRAVRLVSRFIVAGGLTGYILWKIHPRAVLAAGTGADWRPIGIPCYQTALWNTRRLVSLRGCPEFRGTSVAARCRQATSAA